MGFGLDPFGLFPFGFGQPAAAPAPPTLGSVQAGARYINTATGTYEINTVTGQFKQMPALRQRVVLALGTRKGSASSVPGFGSSRPSKMGKFFEAEWIALTRAALVQLTDIEKVMRIDSIQIVRGASGRAMRVVSYTDLTTGEPDQATVP